MVTGFQIGCYGKVIGVLLLLSSGINIIVSIPVYFVHKNYTYEGCLKGKHILCLTI